MHANEAIHTTLVAEAERIATALRRKGKLMNILLAISTSGNSRNILCALEQCRSMENRMIVFTGGNGGKMMDLCDAVIVVPSGITQIVQEAHLTLEHILCGLVERFHFGVERFTSN